MTEERELLSEKTLIYHKKSTNTQLEVILLVFNDMIMLVRSKKADNYTLFRKPIPFESAVLLDKPDMPGKFIFIEFFI